jgi:hypothetical protein
MYKEGLAVAQQLKSYIPDDSNVDQLVKHFKSMVNGGKEEIAKEKLQIK